MPAVKKTATKKKKTTTKTTAKKPAKKKTAKKPAKKKATAKKPAKKPAAKKTAAKKKASTMTTTKKKKTSAKEPAVLLSGGNPQIAKGYGDAPVQAWIEGAPGWKSDVGRKVDALIEKAVPGVEKAVKWNTPMYGVEQGVWFMAMHMLTKSVQVTFFRGTSLDPVPPGASKVKDTRYFHIKEGEDLDVAQMTKWIKKAASLPGDKL